MAIHWYPTGFRALTSDRYRFFDQNPTPPEVLAEVKVGLSRASKSLSPKFFYDQQGSLLFDEITQLPEYYLTRTEIEILKACRHELADFIGKQGCLIEFGSGSSQKVRLLLSSLDPKFYVPVDISREHLHQSAKAIYDEFADLHVYPTCADYTQEVQLPSEVDGIQRCGFFPGSSIGNFEREEACQFLQTVRSLLGSGGFFIVGFDARKAKPTLEAAYNDSQGVTSRFNLNLLANLNAQLNCNFDLSNFQHHAFYDETLGRIEMHLISKEDQLVHVNGHAFTFRAQESIHTENSYKYSIDEIHELAAKAEMRLSSYWQDADARFFVVLLEVT